MFAKKMYIEKHKNGFIFIMFPSLYNISNEIVQYKIKSIAKIFAENFYIKLISNDKKTIDKIQELFNNSILNIKQNSNNFELMFTISVDEITELVNNINCDNVSLELFNFNRDFDLDRFLLNVENNSDFVMYIADNDGPTILFNHAIYDYNKSIAEIKKILKLKHYI